MVGAHYMSDVTFGGTLAFVSCVLMWEIFICKGSHFFAVFPRLKKQTDEGESVEIAEQEQNEQITVENADNRNSVSDIAENEELTVGVINEAGDREAQTSENADTELLSESNDTSVDNDVIENEITE